MKFSAHMIVKNEDQWIWYAINSVLPYADKLFIFDTGSTDKTVELIRSINSEKIIFEEKGKVDTKGLVKLRREQLERTTTEWFLIVDGDEIWPSRELAKLIDEAQKAPKDKIALFNRTRNCVGDVFHYIPDNEGEYKIAGIKGNLNTRMIRNTNDLTIVGEYPQETYTNKNGFIQSQDEKLIFVDCWYLHTTYLKRSSVDFQKTSGSLGRRKLWVKGNKLLNTNLPEVFFKERPKNVNNPLSKRNLLYELIVLALIPLKYIKTL